MPSKLIRNLKPGDRFKVSRDDAPRGKPDTAVVTVSTVQETRSGFMTGRRRWQVIGDYPWWWSIPLVGYSADRIDILPKAKKVENREP